MGSGLFGKIAPWLLMPGVFVSEEDSLFFTFVIVIVMSDLCFV